MNVLTIYLIKIAISLFNINDIHIFIISKEKLLYN